jgi:hypothetical protein
LADFDRELGKLEQRFNELAAEGQALSNSIQRAQADLAFQQTVLTGNTKNGTPDPRILARQVYIEQLNESYLLVEQRAQVVRQSGFAVLERRSAAVARYEAATGELVKQSDTLRKWNKILDKKDKNLPNAKPAKSSTMNALESRLRALKTYIELDLEAEKQRILDSYPELN